MSVNRRRPGHREARASLVLALALFLAVPIPGRMPRRDRQQPAAIELPWESPLPVRESRPIASRSLSRPARHLVSRGETLWSIARQYALDVETVIGANPHLNARRLPVGAAVILPPGSSIRRSAAWQWPLRGRITSRFGPRNGRMHKGLDIAAPAGSSVRAAAAGRVIFAGWCGGFGLLVVLAHPNGWRTYYAHNARLTVSPGQRVSAGEKLADVGATGHATGIHLHFEVVTTKGHTDPLNVLP